MVRACATPMVPATTWARTAGTASAFSASRTSREVVAVLSPV